MASRSSIEPPLRSRVVRGVLGPLSVLVAAMLHGTAPAHAQSPEAPDARADALMRAGVELRVSGHDADALAKFQRAYALVPTARARAQIALAEQSLSLWVDAERHLEEALAATHDAWIRENRAALDQAMRVVAMHLAWVTVDAPDASASFPELYVNGQRAPAWPASPRVRVVAGRVAFELRARGRVPVARVVEVAPETDARAPIEPGRAVSAGPSREPASATSDGSARRTAGFIVVGAGVLGVGIGGAFGLKAISLKQDRGAACPGGLDRCTQAGVDADRAGRSAALASTIATSAGVLAAGVGLWLVLGAPSSTTVRVAPAWNGFVVRGAF